MFDGVWGGWWFLMEHFTKLMKKGGYLVSFHKNKKPQVTSTRYISDDYSEINIVEINQT